MCIRDRENKTLATITFQNYFRLYDKLSGMTGTAMTEQEEFATIYNLDIVEIPTNKPNQRHDHHDVVYKTEAGKFRAVIAQIKAVSYTHLDVYKRQLQTPHQCGYNCRLFCGTKELPSPPSNCCRNSGTV